MVLFISCSKVMMLCFAHFYLYTAPVLFPLLIHVLYFIYYTKEGQQQPIATLQTERISFIGGHKGGSPSAVPQDGTYLSYCD